MFVNKMYISLMYGVGISLRDSKKKSIFLIISLVKSVLKFMINVPFKMLKS